MTRARRGLVIECAGECYVPVRM